MFFFVKVTQWHSLRTHTLHTPHNLAIQSPISIQLETTLHSTRRGLPHNLSISINTNPRLSLLLIRNRKRCLLLPFQVTTKRISDSLTHLFCKNDWQLNLPKCNGFFTTVTFLLTCFICRLRYFFIWYSCNECKVSVNYIAFFKYEIWLKY